MISKQHYKIHVDPTIYQKLTEKRGAVLPTISYVHYQELTKRYIHKYGNKPGKMLVNFICKEKVLIYKKHFVHIEALCSLQNT